MSDPDVRYGYRRCDDGTDRLVAIEDGEAGEPVDVAEVAREVLASLRPPVPGVVTSPPAGSEVLTGMPMYVAVGEEAFAAFSDAVSLGGATLTVALEPVGTVVDAGDGSPSRLCDGAGSVWREGERPDGSECSHTYTHRPEDVGAAGETFALQVQVRYRASFSVTGVVEDAGDLGLLDGPVATVEVPVTERRAVRG